MSFSSGFFPAETKQSSMSSRKRRHADMSFAFTSPAGAEKTLLHAQQKEEIFLPTKKAKTESSIDPKKEITESLNLLIQLKIKYKFHAEEKQADEMLKNLLSTLIKSLTEGMVIDVSIIENYANLLECFASGVELASPAKDIDVEEIKKRMSTIQGTQNFFADDTIKNITAEELIKGAASDLRKAFLVEKELNKSLPAKL